MVSEPRTLRDSSPWTERWEPELTGGRSSAEGNRAFAQTVGITFANNSCLTDHQGQSKPRSSQKSSRPEIDWRDAPCPKWGMGR